MVVKTVDLKEVAPFGDKFRLHFKNTSEEIPLIVDFAKENDLKTDIGF